MSCDDEELQKLSMDDVKQHCSTANQFYNPMVPLQKQVLRLT